MPHKSLLTRHRQDCYTCFLFGLDPGHVPMNFKTAFPASTSFTVIMVIVDDFSKLAHYMALPSEQQMAELLLREDVHYFGGVHGYYHG